MGRQHGCRDALLHPQHSLGLGHKAPLLPHCSCGCKGLRGLFSALLPLQWVPSWSGAGGTGPRDRNTGLEPLLLPKGRAAAEQPKSSVPNHCRVEDAGGAACRRHRRGEACMKSPRTGLGPPQVSAGSCSCFSPLIRPAVSGHRSGNAFGAAGNEAAP